ncbi:MAG: hypothetical protein GXN92_00410 [Candidatus Micrarchaeota archaeon]|nr:hypothetical protein [Candidatus Micrarchaeota archaeon]
MIWVLLLGLAFGGFSYVGFDKPVYEPGETAVLTIQGTIQYIDLQNPPKQASGVWLKVYYPWGYERLYLGDYSLCNECSVPFSLQVAVPVKKEGVFDIRVRLEGSLDLTTGPSRILVYETATVLKAEKTPILNIELPESAPTKGSFHLKLCSSQPIHQVKIVSPILIKPYTWDGIDGCVEEEVLYKGAPVGEQTIPFNISYKTKLGMDRMETIPYKITFFQEKPRFSVVAQDLISGKPSNLTLTIINNGDEAQDVRISSPAITFLEGEVQLGNLFNNKTVKVPAYSDLPPGIYSLPFQVSWKEEGNDKTTLINGSVTIQGEKGLTAYIELGEMPKAGEPFSLSVVVANKELYKVHSVVVEVDGLKVLDGDNIRYIGEIDGDDYNSQQFTILIPQPGEHGFDIKVSYRTPLGETESFVVHKTLEVAGGQKESFPWWIVIVVVIGVIAWIKWKK